MTHWSRSAAQRNVDALVKVGDYYFYGLGVDNESESTRWEKAASYYHSAASTQVSAVAMWDLGWMYENGIGVTQVRAQTDRLHIFVTNGSRTSTWQSGIMI